LAATRVPARLPVFPANRLAIGLAIAAGVTLGQFLTRPEATPLSPADPAPHGERH